MVNFPMLVKSLRGNGIWRVHEKRGVSHIGIPADDLDSIPLDQIDKVLQLALIFSGTKNLVRFCTVCPSTSVF